MKEKLKSLIIKNLPQGIINEIVKPYKELQTYYSQEGEDIILNRIFFENPTGFYVDVGAHHPTRFSNTYKFYLKGWNGINIDAMPGSMDLFNTQRPRDINIETGIGLEETQSTFFVFEEKALNTFDEAIADAYSKTSGIPQEYKIKILPLSDILDKYLPEGQLIDFLSIDVEGLDLEVLQSNDWSRYNPKLILIECLGFNITELINAEVNTYLQGKGYVAFAKTFNTVFYRRLDCQI